MSRFNTINDVWFFLDAIPMFGKVGARAGNFDLAAVKDFCEKMGDPQNRFPSVHIAGTNGKGTTAWLLESVYREAGYKTGLFTSPHLLRYNERFRISGIEVSDEQLLEFFREYDELLQQIKLTYFEISTVLAFWFFDRLKVDIAIIETGLGGRLDSTNIIKPLVSVITSIGMDHMDILGNTLSEIAMEKAGIIKKHTPVVIGNLPQAAERVVSGKSGVEQSRVYRASDLRPVYRNGTITFKSTGQQFNTIFKEEINKWNVAMTYKATEVLQHQFPITQKLFRKAMEAFGGVPGRFEKVHQEYEWYFSGAHNVEALSSVMDAVNRLDKDPILILSFMKDKLSDDLVAVLKKHKSIYYNAIDSERSADESMIKEQLSAEIISDDGIQAQLNELKTSLVIFAGSFYFYPTVRRWISTF